MKGLGYFERVLMEDLVEGGSWACHLPVIIPNFIYYYYLVFILFYFILLLFFSSRKEINSSVRGPLVNGQEELGVKQSGDRLLAVLSLVAFLCRHQRIQSHTTYFSHVLLARFLKNHASCWIYE